MSFKNYLNLNIQEEMNSLNATSSIDVNMFDNIPNPNGASPGCSKFSDKDLHTNKNKNYFENIDTSSNNISENDNFDSIEESSDLTSDKEVKQLETNNEIIDNDDNDLTNNEIIDNAMLETNKNKGFKKKSVRSTNREIFAQVFDNCIQKLIKSKKIKSNILLKVQ